MIIPISPKKIVTFFEFTAGRYFCTLNMLIMSVISFRLLLTLILWHGFAAVAQYLRDEDVHLKIYSPPSATGQSAIALELVIYNRDEEFFVSILSEEGSTICEGQFSRFSADRVKCSYNTDILRDGDNFFHVTIRSMATKEVVLDTISHFFYDAHRVVPASVTENVVEYWDVLISLLLLFLLLRYGRSTYRSVQSMIYDPSSGGTPPPPPTLPVPTYNYYIPPPSPPLTISPSQPTNIQINIRGSLLWKAALIGAAVLLGGKVVFGPRRNNVVVQQRTLPPSAQDLPAVPPQDSSKELYAAYASGGAEFATLGAPNSCSSYPCAAHIAAAATSSPLYGEGRTRKYHNFGVRPLGQLRKVGG